MDLSSVVHIKYRGKEITAKQIKIIELLLETKSQNKVAKILNIPTSSVNIQIKRLEKKLGLKIIQSSTSGTVVTEEGQQILEFYRRIKRRMEKNSFIACGFICGEVGRILFEDVVISSFDNILKLYRMGMVNILGIDDPYWSYRLGDPIPVVYDYMVMVYRDRFDVKNLVGIRYSPQRILWNILKSRGVSFKIRKVVKDPLKGIELVKKGYSLFLNESLVKYVDEDLHIERPPFYRDTKHTLNFIGPEDEETVVKAIRRRKKELENRGFEVVE
ncbi:MAG TPA: LysR family transcriptional regulator [Methanothermococcus okinawensis]|uniref:LysR family transcriptional regulator n=1 Tax=Methanothermococcus okinawensis TaxID=155863 RepID=A0A832ZE35_9EURY|nr:LysR family transcriptional regulator [Methanococcaceae archaeon]HIP84873.1 LysR family transcriptional regulator [Methanothermococcus okinawensis]HIP90878.1 LysR family transcriptional regulator [Methanothermococcus okinawensis]